MRRNRIILMVLWILSLVLITVSGTQAAYGFFILLTMIPALSLFYIFLVNHYFKIYQHINGHDLIANHRSDYEFILQNDSFIPFAGIRVKAVVIQDFFRLFSFTRKIRRPLFVRVKPDIIRLDDLASDRETLNTLRENSFRRNVADFLLRDYIPGDDLRFINWKVSAASQKLMVRQMNGEERQGIALIMDSCRYTEDPREYLPIENKILETVIALDLYFLQKAIPVTVFLEEEAVEELSGDSLQSFETNARSFPLQQHQKTSHPL